MTSPTQDGQVFVVGEDCKLLMHRAVSFHNEGDLEQAEKLYRQVLVQQPENADALHLLGFLACQLEFPEAGIELIEQAIALNPQEPLYLNNLAEVYIGLSESEKAEDAYRRSLKIKGDNEDVLNDLANLIVTTKPSTKVRLREAEKLFRKAIKLNPKKAIFHNNLGTALRDLEKFNLAKACYERALKLDPSLFGVYGNLGILEHHNDDLDGAVKLFKKAIELNPKDAKSHNNLADVLVNQKKLDEAIIHYEIAIENETDTAIIYLNLGSALLRRCRYEEALDALVRSMSLYPQEKLNYLKFTQALRMMDRMDDAESFARDSLSVEPDNPILQTSLSLVLMERLDDDGAEEILRKLLKDYPDSASHLGNLALVLAHKGEIEDSFALFKRALELEPDNAEIHWNHSLILLAYGNLELGWQEYEWRYLTDTFPSPVRFFSCSQWDGSPLKGKKILLWGEQGLGEHLRFASMITDIIAMGADVTIECEDRLVDLFARSFEGTKVVKQLDDVNIDTFDFHCPFPSLSMHVRPTLESFPQNRRSYLKADPKRVAFWRERFNAMGPRPKIGIVWRSLFRTEDRNSFYADIKELEPFLTLPGVDFVNLQCDECSDELAEAQEQFGATLHDWDDLDQRFDLDETSAMIANLDMVISCPSAVGEISAGMGIPTYEFFAEKVYCTMLGVGMNEDAHDSIWHPSLRYFTKQRDEPWKPVLEMMAKDVRQKFNL